MAVGQLPKIGLENYPTGIRHLEHCYHLRRHPELVRQATVDEMQTMYICKACAKAVGYALSDAMNRPR